jgi:hypothetical protein
MAKDVEEIDDAEFDSLVEEARHKEVISALRKIVVVLSEDKGIADAVDKNTKEIGIFVEKIKALKPPEVNVEVNQDNILALADTLSKSLDKQKSYLVGIKEAIDRQNDYLEMLSRPKEMDFKIERSYNGFIDSVTVKQKPLKT